MGCFIALQLSDLKWLQFGIMDPLLAMRLVSRVRCMGYSPVINPASINSRLNRRASAPLAQR